MKPRSLSGQCWRVMRLPALIALVLLSSGVFSSAFAAPVHEHPSAATTCCVENRTTLQLNEVWRVEATSFRPPPSAANQGAAGEPHTSMTALRFDGQQWQTAFTSKFAGAYNAHLNVRQDITYGNQPVALLDFQLGAALETLTVYGLKDEHISVLQTLEAGAFEWSFDPRRGTVALIALPASPGDEAIVYRWNGQRFVERPTGRNTKAR